ncbi:hypothetical protein FAI41_06935 [Acetobacteraceae bacterium]|nr:hypothetical protein FAI41_06935 [Acetobacteraceae bacterium]
MEYDRNMLMQKRLKHLLITASALLLSSCMVPDPTKYPDLDNNPKIISTDNIAYLNASINHQDSIPKPIKSIHSLSPINHNRLAEIGIMIPKDPNNVTRYLTLHFTDHSSDSGILVEELHGSYAPVKTIWYSDAMIVHALHLHDDQLENAKQGKDWAGPDFYSPKMKHCVARVTAQGLSEEYPFQAWNYCSDPQTNKDLTPVRSRFNWLWNWV